MAKMLLLLLTPQESSSRLPGPPCHSSSKSPLATPCSDTAMAKHWEQLWAVIALLGCPGMEFSQSNTTPGWAPAKILAFPRVAAKE
ncbi:hypothetical protein TURU_104859 [Turdus rufiventris]|nr:hypothetical protein TURU_104859 [Turdus rufiventris]